MDPLSQAVEGDNNAAVLSDPRWEIEADEILLPPRARIRSGGFRGAATPTEVNASAIAARLNYNTTGTTVTGRQGDFIVGAGVVRTIYKFVGGTGVGNINDTYDYNHGSLAVTFAERPRDVILHSFNRLRPIERVDPDLFALSGFKQRIDVLH